MSSAAELRALSLYEREEKPIDISLSEVLTLARFLEVSGRIGATSLYRKTPLSMDSASIILSVFS